MIKADSSQYPQTLPIRHPLPRNYCIYQSLLAVFSPSETGQSENIAVLQAQECPRMLPASKELFAFVLRPYASGYE